MIKGNIHSIETMGLVDGPGIRVDVHSVIIQILGLFQEGKV